MDNKRLATIYAYKTLLLAIVDSINTDRSKIAKELGLTIPQHHLLWVIHFKPGCTLSQLAEYSLSTVANVKHVVDNLVKKEVVVKYIDPKDARARRVYLTERGEELIKKAAKSAEGYRVLSMLDKLQEEEVQKNMETLFSVVENLQSKEYVEFLKTNINKLLG
ncbi:MAG: MarR family transcriptional regulator [Firmicutes bacterium]|nr:MarR family transcriptional regulator [Bacillota bacterium]